MNSRMILWTIVFLLATPLWMRVAWEFSTKKKLSIIIVDKTVLNSNSFKHRSLNWILDYEKYTKRDGSFYDINTDYFGFFPSDNEEYTVKDFENYSDTELDSITSLNDMVYFTDTYGILGNEWYRHRDINETSESIYGGLSEKDMLLLKKMKQRGKPILTEFNTIGFPTPFDVRKDFENTFGLQWTGWIARYIASLDTVNNPDLPKWILRTYKRQHNGVWPFHKEGMLFIHESGKVLVLEKDRELKEALPRIYTEQKYQVRFGLPASIIYPFWFDVMTNKNDTNELVSKYIISTTPVGDRLFASNDIPKIFPAILHREKNYNFYYFCGDFADNPTKFRFAKLEGITGLKFLMYNAVDVTDRNRFFWEFYLPMMQNILAESFGKRFTAK